MAFKNSVIMEFRRLDRDMILTAGTGHPDYKISRVDGLTGLPYTFTTSVNPQVPGTEINNMRAEPRVISFEIGCGNELREHAIAFFNPLHTIKLTAEWNGVQRWIAGRAKPVKVVTPNIYRKITLTVELYCQDPMWRDMDDYGTDITQRQPLLAFPFVMLAGRGHVASYRVPSNAVTLNNTGDVPVPIRAVLQPYGDISNPRLTLNDTEYIQVNVDMHSGDELDINTDPKDIYVRLNGENALKYTDRSGRFFQFPVGENVLTYDAGGPSAQGTVFDMLSVIIYFTPQYLGV